ncbi:MAG TPA: VOC family protein [Flavisolibacter sp.]|nr:VOC family protein [Flavisolibacter sp.]
MMERNLLQGIDTVIVRVTDIERSKKWYTDILGFGITWDEPKMKLVVLNTSSNVSLTLWQTDETISINKNTASYPIFRTPDASALRINLEEKGVSTESIVTDDYVTYFFFYDPDGNILEACQVHE